MTRAQVVDAFGGPEQFRAAEVPLAALQAGEVRMRIAAAAVNPVDLSTRAGKLIAGDVARFPMVIGWDAAGTVEAVGDGVTGWRIGDRVAAMIVQPAQQNGAYAERVNLASGLLARLPDGVSFEHAATIPLAGLTASQMLRWVDVPAGGTLLVDAPLGAVGRFVVQLARVRDVNVVAVAEPNDGDKVQELGAVEVVSKGDFTAAVRSLHPGGVDAAIDLVGGTTARAALASVRTAGAYITSVPPFQDATGPFTSERDIRFDIQNVHPDTTALNDLLTAVAGGELITSVERTYPLAQAVEAHRRQAQGGLRGKLILLP